MSGERRTKAGEGECQLLGPGPSAIEAQVDDAPAAGDAGGHVQDPVAEGGDLAVGEGRLVGEADELGPADEVEGGEYAFEPGVVLGYLLARQVAQARALAWRIRSSTRAW